MVKSIVRVWRALRRDLQPLTVAVEWNGLQRWHKAATRAEALGWMGCYPRGANVAVYGRFGRLLAHRPPNGGSHAPC